MSNTFKKLNIVGGVVRQRNDRPISSRLRTARNMKSVAPLSWTKRTATVNTLQLPSPLKATPAEVSTLLRAPLPFRTDPRVKVAEQLVSTVGIVGSETLLHTTAACRVQTSTFAAIASPEGARAAHVISWFRSDSYGNHLALDRKPCQSNGEKPTLLLLATDASKLTWYNTTAVEHALILICASNAMLTNVKDARSIHDIDSTKRSTWMAGKGVFDVCMTTS